MEKFCPKCKTLKSFDNFHKKNGSKDGLQLWCNQCSLEAKNHQYKTSRRLAVNAHARKTKLKSYGLTVQKYDKLFKDQNGLCAICGNPETQMSNKKYGNVDKLRVDHDHKTGKIRGLLCAKCNFAIGLFQDNFDYMLNACNYLFLSKDVLKEGNLEVMFIYNERNK